MFKHTFFVAIKLGKSTKKVYNLTPSIALNNHLCLSFEVKLENDFLRARPE